MKQILTSILVVLLFSCKKEDVFRIDASQITSRDVFGNIISAPDPSDWTITDVWNSREIELFNFSDTITSAALNRPDTVSFIGMYPNPVSKSGQLRFDVGLTNPPTKIKLVFVDESFNVILRETFLLPRHSNSNFSTLALSFNMQYSSFEVNKYYRVYYSFFDRNGMTSRRGHGDILVRP